MEKMSYHERLKFLTHKYVLLVYKLTKKFPTYERFGLISQGQRAAVSTMLNYIEGYRRMRNKVMIQFFETAYASLKESVYVCFLGAELEYITREEYQEVRVLEDEISAMLYSTMEGIRKKDKE